MIMEFPDRPLEFWIEISKILINFSVTRHVNKQQSVKSKAVEFSSVIYSSVFVQWCLQQARSITINRQHELNASSKIK